ncbi:hypothetical protein HYALB_00004228 [Hymenoscyphus albidus]|uniref:Uncharacterized protein n=1 Tax=Hymenoscyphus albidus TaxID=595503 RepID=A0A9N9LZL3_9HELO|nr:hypothetical protein HYALB_00004228 [Hymenoscyphus albidus]
MAIRRPVVQPSRRVQKSGNAGFASRLASPDGTVAGRLGHQEPSWAIFRRCATGAGIMSILRNKKSKQETLCNAIRPVSGPGRWGCDIDDRQSISKLRAARGFVPMQMKGSRATTEGREGKEWKTRSTRSTGRINQ